MSDFKRKLEISAISLTQNDIDYGNIKYGDTVIKSIELSCTKEAEKGGEVICNDSWIMVSPEMFPSNSKTIIELSVNTTGLARNKSYNSTVKFIAEPNHMAVLKVKFNIPQITAEELASLESSLAKQRAEVNEIENKYSSLQSRFESLQKELSEKEITISKLESRLESLDDLEQEYTKMRAENKKMKSDLLLAKDKLEAIQAVGDLGAKAVGKIFSGLKNFKDRK